MGLNLEQKKAVVAEVAEVAASSSSAVASEYRGLTVTQMTTLRQEAHKNGVYLRVVKNTLARRALQDTEFACLEDSLKGPLLLAFSRHEPSAAARLIQDFLKDKANNKLVVTALAIGGKQMPASQLDQMAKLPTKDEAIALLMACMRAPVEKMARTLNEVPGKLVRTVEAVRVSKA